MAKVDIKVRGIAMSYQKEGKWHVLFPFGDCHEVKFKENEDELGISLADENVVIRVTAEGADSLTAAGDTYDRFLDLTAPYSHEDGVRINEGWETKAVLMTIENATFSMDHPTQIDHFMYFEDTVTRPPGEIGYNGKMLIEAEKVIVEVERHPDFPKTFTDDCTLIFDNDCANLERRRVSDFDMVYNVVEDVNDPEKRFKMAKVSDRIQALLIEGTVLNEDQLEYLGKRDSFADGLPCHKVRISKADGLP